MLYLGLHLLDSNIYVNELLYSSVYPPSSTPICIMTAWPRLPSFRPHPASDSIPSRFSNSFLEFYFVFLSPSCPLVPEPSP